MCVCVVQVERQLNCEKHSDRAIASSDDPSCLQTVKQSNAPVLVLCRSSAAATTTLPLRRCCAHYLFFLSLSLRSTGRSLSLLPSFTDNFLDARVNLWRPLAAPGTTFIPPQTDGPTDKLKSHRLGAGRWRLRSPPSLYPRALYARARPLWLPPGL